MSYGKLTVPTVHHPTPRQAEMIAAYVKQDNARLIAQDEDENVIYRLTDDGRRYLKPKETTT